MARQHSQMSDAELDAAFAAAMRTGTPPRQTESQFRAQVVKLAEQLGLRVYWIPSMARSNIGRVAKTARGWPDLTLAGPNGVLFRELKAQDGETSAEQDDWLWLLRHGGLNADVWRRSDWQSGRIRTELQEIA